MKLRNLKLFSLEEITPKGNTVKPQNDFFEFKKEEINGSIVQRFEKQVEKYPDKVAIKCDNRLITYDFLNKLINRLAHGILEKYPEPGGTAALLFGHNENMVAGLFGALKAGKIYVPLEPNYPLERLKYILADLKTSVIITGNANLELAEFLRESIDKTISIMNVDHLPENLPVENPNVTITPDDKAYVLYTSGSTGKPKGVVQNHRNVLHFARVYANNLHIHPEDRLTLFSSYSFDAAKMDIYGALLNGATLYPFSIKSEGQFNRLPAWLMEERITIYHSVPTVYRYFVEMIPSGETFNYIRLIVLGGEAVFKEDVEKYKKKFLSHCIFINGLGPTESTVTLQYFIGKETEIAKESVPVGFPVADTEVFLIDEKNEEAQVYGVGEIVYKSEHLALGYLNDPEKSFSAFQKHPITNEGRVYRTGDLGRRLPDGNIEYVGRKDFQVKVRGYRIELGEIEGRLDRVPGIKKSIVVCQKDQLGENYLTAYYMKNSPTIDENGNPINVEESSLVNILRESLPSYMVPDVFYEVDDLPQTSTGKIDRKALTDRTPQVVKTESPKVPPRNPVEAKLIEIMKELLKTDQVSIEDNYFVLGGNSLNAVLLAANIHKAFEVKIPLAEIFRKPTAKEMAQIIGELKKQEYYAIEPVEEKEYYPLSSAQKRLFILQEMDPESTAYNMLYTFPLGSEIEKDKLESVLRKMIRRHESLRTSFTMINELPVQIINPEVEFHIEYVEILSIEGNSDTTVREKLNDFVRPFDLAYAPLMRSRVVKLPDGNYLWLVDIHHIITDGSSRTILTQDFMNLYGENVLPPLKLQYKDYSAWQNRMLESGDIKKQEEYWLNVLSGEIPRLDFLTDYKRPNVFDFAGKHYRFAIEKQDAAAFKTIGSGVGATLYMNILAALNVLFYKYTGQTDIIIGTSIAGRPHADLQGIIGMFVNNLAMRNYPGEEKTYREFLSEVKENSLAAFDNQDVQFEELIDKLNLERDPSRNPLFDISMLVQNFENVMNRSSVDEPQTESAPETDENPPQSIDNMTAKFDMTFIVHDSPGQIGFILEYYSSIFKDETIRRIVSHFKNLVKAIGTHPELKLKDIDILSEKEREQILVEFNNSETDVPRDKTIQALFAEQVEKTPDRIALVGPTLSTAEEHPGNSASHIIQLSYRALNEKANQLANQLLAKGVEPDTIVAIKIDRSIEMMIGLLGILKAGGAYLPIDPEFPQERIEYMLKDSCTKITLTAIEVAKHLQTNDFTNVSPVRGIASDLAYVIYTSGTTGKPKGNLTIHSNVIRVVKNTNYIDLTPEDRLLQLSNFAFDGSIFDIYGALLNGSALVLIKKKDVPAVDRLSEIIKRESITVFFVTTALFNALVDIDIESFSGLRKVLFGGERVSVNHARKALERMGEERIIHVYGPTETTVYATYYPIDRIDEHAETIPIGKPLANTTTYVLDRNGEILPLGAAGELVIGGEGVARGYLNRPELTAEKFVESLRGVRTFLEKGSDTSKNFCFDKEFDKEKETKSFCPTFFKKLAAGGTLYRSGDLVRWLPDGNIEFIGRIDQQVKIRGFRIELGEIQAQLLKIEAVKEAVVLVKEEGTEKTLCAYIVPNREITDTAEIRNHLSRLLPDYMIPTYFVFLERIPLTPNGKLDKKALPKPVLTSDTDYIAPRNETEEKLTRIWAEVLGIDASVIGMEKNFFELGGHSLKATVLTSKIHKEFEVKIPLVEVFKMPTISGLSEYIRASKKIGYQGIEPIEEKEYYPLSPAQKRLCFLQQIDPAGVAYNMPFMIPLGSEANVQRFETILKRLIARHESLRTSFVTLNGELVQRIEKEIDFSILHYDISPNDIAGGTSDAGSQIVRQLTQPFDLSRAPLLRAIVISGLETGPIMFIDMHHVITDGTSQDILRNEFLTLYADPEIQLPSLTLQYKDYSHWQNSQDQQSVIAKQRDYWTKQFDDESPVLELPMDYPRPVLQSFEGQTMSFVLPGNTAQELKRLALKHDCTLYMLLISVFYTLLAKLGNQEDIVVGTPVAGRRHADLDKIIGMFVNTLALRNFPQENKTFKDFLDEVKKRTLEAFENQEYQFEDLVDQLSVRRDTSRNPLFDVMFTLFELKGDLAPVSEEDIEHHADNQRGISKFDLTLNVKVAPSQILFSFEYCTRLFKEETIRRMISYFKRVAAAIIQNPDEELSQIDILSEEERNRLLIDFNRTQSEYPNEQTIHELFETQVEKTPDHIAINGVSIHPENKPGNMYQLTYRELDLKAHRLARVLIEKGIVPDTIVAIKVKRSIDMIIGILGILKAGGAYLPIDPEYPQDRIDYMLKDSTAKIMLGFSEAERIENTETIEIFSNVSPAGLSFQSEIPQLSAANLAYIIYTSGTTGRPKGVAVEHGGVVNMLVSRKKEYLLDTSNASLQLFSFAFDGFVTSFFTPLISGTRGILVNEDELKDITRLKNRIVKEYITHFISVPALYRLIIENMTQREFKYIKSVTLAGDRLSSDIFEMTREKNPETEIVQEYGVTEASVMSTIYRHQEKDPMSKVGHPISNTAIYILNKSLELQPIGVPGELCIGGTGLSRGYLNRPELTDEKFITQGLFWDCLYRSGDLARWLDDGNIEFIGRIDQQVKVRGFRIELGEIEARIRECENVKDVVVIVNETDRMEKTVSEKYLCAYIVSEPQTHIDIDRIKNKLSEHLPAYMVPSYFIPLEEIPLTSIGKVDRKSLPKPEIQITREVIAPVDELEESLVRMIAGELHIEKDKISTDASFFDLGGHSLKATSLISKIRKEFNISIPLLEFFKTPTVKAMGDYIRPYLQTNETIFAQETDQNTPNERLVLLREGAQLSEDSNRPNLFLIHDGTGEVEGYLEFCKSVTLPDNFNCWGIRANPEESISPQNRTIEGIANEYIGAMQSIQPEGPYYIAGWSLGGSIAFEIGTQLEQKNLEIAFLGLIDAVPPNQAMRESFIRFDLESEMKYLSQFVNLGSVPDFAVSLKRVPGTEEFWAAVADYLEMQNFDVEIVKNVIRSYGMHALPNYDMLDIRQAIYYLNMGRTLANARAKYWPSISLKTPVYYFAAEGSKQNIDKDGWKLYCKEPVAFTQVKGDHYSIFKSPEVEAFSELFSSIIEKKIKR